MIFLVRGVGGCYRKVGCCVGVWARLFADRSLIEVPSHHACGMAPAAAKPFWFSQLQLRGWRGTKRPQVYKYTWAGKEDNFKSSLDLVLLRDGAVDVWMFCILLGSWFPTPRLPPRSIPLHVSSLCCLDCHSANCSLSSRCEPGITICTVPCIISFHALPSARQLSLSVPCTNEQAEIQDGEDTHPHWSAWGWQTRLYNQVSTESRSLLSLVSFPPIMSGPLGMLTGIPSTSMT